MANDGVLRVVQLNMGSLLEPEWDRRRHEVLAWFDILDPDVVCLQEVWESEDSPNTAGWLVEHSPAGSWHWCFGGLPLPDVLWPDPSVRFGSAILSRWPIDHHELLPLPVDAESPNPFRRLAMELLHARTAGVDVFSTHTAPEPAHAFHRLRQVLFIDEMVRDRRDREAPMPPVLCGDFNAEPMSDEMRYLNANAVIDGRSTYYQDAWRAAGHTDAGWTQDPAGNPEYAKMRLPPKRIDYVWVGDCFLRPEGAGQVLAADLAFHTPKTGILASDHFGLSVDVRWPQRPGQSIQ